MGVVQQPVSNAAEGQGQVGVTMRAEHQHPRIVLVGHIQDVPCDVPVVGFADFSLRGDAGLLEVIDDLSDQPLAVAFWAVHLQPPETADRELVHMKDDDPVAAVPA